MKDSKNCYHRKNNRCIMYDCYCIDKADSCVDYETKDEFMDKANDVIDRINFLKEKEESINKLNQKEVTE